MAYELKRSPKVTKEVVIGDETLTIKIDAGVIAREFNTRYNNIIRAKDDFDKAKESNDNTPAALENVLRKLGNAISALMELCFGNENTAKIIAYYEGNYLEMIEYVIPFIIDEIMPAIKQAIAEKAEYLKKTKYRK